MNFDYELYKIIDESGYVPCEENLEILKEDIFNEFIGNMIREKQARNQLKNITALRDPKLDSIKREKIHSKVTKYNEKLANSSKRVDALNNVVAQQKAGNNALRAAHGVLNTTPYVKSNGQINESGYIDVETLKEDIFNEFIGNMIRQKRANDYMRDATRLQNRKLSKIEKLKLQKKINNFEATLNKPKQIEALNNAVNNRARANNAMKGAEEELNNIKYTNNKGHID